MEKNSIQEKENNVHGSNKPSMWTHLKAFIISLSYDGRGTAPGWIEQWLKNDRKLRDLHESQIRVTKNLMTTSEDWMRTTFPKPERPFVPEMSQETRRDHYSSYNTYSWINLAFATLMVGTVGFLLYSELTKKPSINISENSNSEAIRAEKPMISNPTMVSPAGFFGVPHKGYAVVSTLSSSVSNTYREEAQNTLKVTKKSIIDIPLKLFPEELVASTQNLMNSSVAP